MNLTRQKVCVLFATAVFTLANLHIADAGSVLFDDFSTGSSPVFAVGPGSVSTSNNNPSGSVLSPDLGRRDLSIKTDIGPGLVIAVISAAKNEVNFATDGSTTFGRFHVDYIFGPTKSLNLSNATKITLRGNFDGSAIGTSLGVKLIDSMNNMFTQVFSLASPSPFSKDFLMNGFTGVNLSNLKFISFGTYNNSGVLVNATPDADIRITNFSYDVVPEPSSFALFAMMMTSVLWYRRRSTKLYSARA